MGGTGLFLRTAAVSQTGRSNARNPTRSNSSRRVPVGEAAATGASHTLVLQKVQIGTLPTRQMWVIKRPGVTLTLKREANDDETLP
jgi:hypothetical protein